MRAGLGLQVGIAWEEGLKLRQLDVSGIVIEVYLDGTRKQIHPDGTVAVSKQ